MDKTLVGLGAALVAAGISAVPKARSFAALVGAGLASIAAGIAVERTRAQAGSAPGPRHGPDTLGSRSR